MLAEKLHEAAVDILHGPMRDKTLTMIEQQKNDLPQAFASITTMIFDVLHDSIGGTVPPGVLFRVLISIISELVEMAQAMGLVTEDDEAAYHDLIPPAVQHAATMLGKKATDKGVVTSEQMQTAQQNMLDMGGSFAAPEQPQPMTNEV